MRKSKRDTIIRDVARRAKDIERHNTESRIKEARYNARYKQIMNNRILIYLKKDKGGRNINLITRIRCKNFEEVNKYWLHEIKRLCILCKKDKGTLIHLFEKYEIASEWCKDIKGKREEKLRMVTNERKDRRLVKAFRKIERKRREYSKEVT